MTDTAEMLQRYPSAHLPHLLRDQVDAVLRCEAEPHVIEDARAIVAQAADFISAALHTLPASTAPGKMSVAEAELMATISKMHMVWMLHEQLHGKVGGFELMEQMADQLDVIRDTVPELYKRGQAVFSAPSAMLAASPDTPPQSGEVDSQ